MDGLLLKTLFKWIDLGVFPLFLVQHPYVEGANLCRSSGVEFAVNKGVGSNEDAWRAKDGTPSEVSHTSGCVWLIGGDASGMSRNLPSLRILGPCYRGVWMCIAGFFWISSGHQ